MTTISKEYQSVLTTFCSNISVYYSYVYVANEFWFINNKQIILCQGNNLLNI